MSTINRIICILGVMFSVSLFISHTLTFEETIILMLSLYLYFTFGKTDEEKKS